MFCVVGTDTHAVAVVSGNTIADIISGTSTGVGNPAGGGTCLDVLFAGGALTSARADVAVVVHLCCSTGGTCFLFRL